MEEVREEGSWPLALTLRKGPVSVEIHYDQDPRNPREEFDCYVGTMACSHSRYDLGDKGSERIVSELQECESWQGMYDYLRREHGATVVMPLYLLDHSGLALSAGAPFSGNQKGSHYACDPGGWDTSTVGFIFDTEEGRERTGVELESVAKSLAWEVEEYGYYVNGEVFFFVGEGWDGDGECIGGYYGADAAEEAAQEELERLWDEYVEHRDATRDWAKRMGVAFRGATVPVELAP